MEAILLKRRSGLLGKSFHPRFFVFHNDTLYWREKKGSKSTKGIYQLRDITEILLSSDQPSDFAVVFGKRQLYLRVPAGADEGDRVKQWLNLLLVYDGAAIKGVNAHIPFQNVIATGVNLCLDYLTLYGFSVPSVLKQEAASDSRIDEWYGQVLLGKTGFFTRLSLQAASTSNANYMRQSSRVSSDADNVHAVASLLKRLLCEAPESVFTNALLVAFLALAPAVKKAGNQGSERLRVARQLADLVNSMPHQSAVFLLRIVFLCSRVVDARSSQMTVRSVAQALGHCMVTAHTHPRHRDLLVKAKKHVCVVNNRARKRIDARRDQKELSAILEVLVDFKEVIFNKGAPFDEDMYTAVAMSSISVGRDAKTGRSDAGGSKRRSSETPGFTPERKTQTPSRRSDVTTPNRSHNDDENNNVDSIDKHLADLNAEWDEVDRQDRMRAGGGTDMSRQHSFEITLDDEVEHSRTHILRHNTAKDRQRGGDSGGGGNSGGGSGGGGGGFAGPAHRIGASSSGPSRPSHSTPPDASHTAHTHASPSPSTGRVASSPETSRVSRLAAVFDNAAQPVSHPARPSGRRDSREDRENRRNDSVSTDSRAGDVDENGGRVSDSDASIPLEHSLETPSQPHSRESTSSSTLKEQSAHSAHRSTEHTHRNGAEEGTTRRSTRSSPLTTDNVLPSTFEENEPPSRGHSQSQLSELEALRQDHQDALNVNQQLEEALGRATQERKRLLIQVAQAKLKASSKPHDSSSRPPSQPAAPPDGYVSKQRMQSVLEAVKQKQETDANRYKKALADLSIRLKETEIMREETAKKLKKDAREKADRLKQQEAALRKSQSRLRSLAEENSRVNMQVAEFREKLEHSERAVERGERELRRAQEEQEEQEQTIRKLESTFFSPASGAPTGSNDGGGSGSGSNGGSGGGSGRGGGGGSGGGDGSDVSVVHVPSGSQAHRNTHSPQNTPASAPQEQPSHHTHAPPSDALGGSQLAAIQNQLAAMSQLLQRRQLDNGPGFERKRRDAPLSLAELDQPDGRNAHSRRHSSDSHNEPGGVNEVLEVGRAVNERQRMEIASLRRALQKSRARTSGAWVQGKEDADRIADTLRATEQKLMASLSTNQRLMTELNAREARIRFLETQMRSMEEQFQDKLTAVRQVLRRREGQLSAALNGRVAVDVGNGSQMSGGERSGDSRSVSGTPGLVTDLQHALPITTAHAGVQPVFARTMPSTTSTSMSSGTPVPSTASSLAQSRNRLLRLQAKARSRLAAAQHRLEAFDWDKPAPSDGLSGGFSGNSRLGVGSDGVNGMTHHSPATHAVFPGMTLPAAIQSPSVPQSFASLQPPGTVGSYGGSLNVRRDVANNHTGMRQRGANFQQYHAQPGLVSNASVGGGGGQGLGLSGHNGVTAPAPSTPAVALLPWNWLSNTPQGSHAVDSVNPRGGRRHGGVDVHGSSAHDPSGAGGFSTDQWMVSNRGGVLSNSQTSGLRNGRSGGAGGGNVSVPEPAHTLRYADSGDETGVYGVSENGGGGHNGTTAPDGDVRWEVELQKAASPDATIKDHHHTSTIHSASSIMEPTV